MEVVDRGMTNYRIGRIRPHRPASVSILTTSTTASVVYSHTCEQIFELYSCSVVVHAAVIVPALMGVQVCKWPDWHTSLQCGYLSCSWTACFFSDRSCVKCVQSCSVFVLVFEHPFAREIVTFIVVVANLSLCTHQTV